MHSTFDMGRLTFDISERRYAAGKPNRTKNGSAPACVIAWAPFNPRRPKTMVSSIALLLLGAFATTPCENLKSVELKQATITAADFVPEGPAPARGGGGGARGARGGAARGEAAAPAAPAAPAQPPAMIPAHCRVQ